MSRGVFYIGTGESYFDEAVTSARSVKRIHDIDVAIVTTAELADTEDTAVFDDVIVSEQVYHDLRDKVFNIHKSPFEKTIYLDTDSEVVASIEPLFSMLDNFDLAVAESSSKDRVSIEGVPDAFPELNTGVLAFNATESVNKLFANWLSRYDDQLENGRPSDTFPVEDGNSLEEITGFGRFHDQPPFRVALYNSDASFSVLPDEYNFGRWGCSYAYSDVKILHGPKQQRELLKESINERVDRRMYLGSRRNLGSRRDQKIVFRSGETLRLISLHEQVLALIYRAHRIYKTKGIRALLRKGARYLRRGVYRWPSQYLP